MKVVHNRWKVRRFASLDHRRVPSGRPFGPNGKWNIDILSQNAASRMQFFQVQTIKTGHISIIHQQIGDILSVSSKGTAATKSRMKKITLQILQVLTPNFHNNPVSAQCKGRLQCVAPVMHELLTQRSSHLQKRPSNFARIWEIKWFRFF